MAIYLDVPKTIEKGIKLYRSANDVAAWGPVESIGLLSSIGLVRRCCVGNSRLDICTYRYIICKHILALG